MQSPDSEANLGREKTIPKPKAKNGSLRPPGHFVGERVGIESFQSRLAEEELKRRGVLGVLERMVEDMQIKGDKSACVDWDMVDKHPSAVLRWDAEKLSDTVYNSIRDEHDKEIARDFLWRSHAVKVVLVSKNRIEVARPVRGQDERAHWEVLSDERLRSVGIQAGSIKELERHVNLAKLLTEAAGVKALENRHGSDRGSLQGRAGVKV